MNDRFVNFFVFDSRFGELDQSPGDIIYFLSSDEKINQDENKRYIITGICTTIINLCGNFNTSTCCDYLVTDSSEMSILPIAEDLYFYISLKLKSGPATSSCFTSAMMSMAPINKGFSKSDSCLSPFHICETHSRKQLLQNVLMMIKKILFLNVEPPKRDEKTGKFSESFKSSVNFYMPIILNIFDWNELSITQLWSTSVFISKLPTNVNHEFRKELKELHSKNDFIYGLILTNKSQVIAHTTDPELTNILTLLVSKRYRLYYPYSVKEKENHIHWTIGFNFDTENGNSYGTNLASVKSILFSSYWSKNKTKNDFVNLITPPLFWNEKTLALAALKYNSVILIIVFDPLQADADRDLNSFKDLVSPVLINCDSFNNDNKTENDVFIEEIDSRFKRKAGAKLFCNFKKNKIQLLKNRIQNADFDLLKYATVFANETNFFILNELMNQKSDSSLFLNNCENFFSESTESEGGFLLKKLSNLSTSSMPPNLNNDNPLNYARRNYECANSYCNKADVIKVENKSELNSKDKEKLIVHTKSVIPLNSGFFLFVEQKNGKFTNIFIKNKLKGISGTVEYCEAIDDCI